VSAESQSESSIDQQFRSLLEGLRTSIPAVQVLFAFLLTAPFQAKFDSLSTAEHVAFAIAFFSSGAASVLLVAPSIHQRLRAPATGMQRHSHRHLVWAIWLGIAGSLAALIAISATVYLVASVIYDANAAIIGAALITALSCWSWVFIPIVTFRSDD